MLLMWAVFCLLNSESMSILGSHGLMQEEQFPLSPKSESAHSAVRAAFDNVAIDQVKEKGNL